MTGSPCAVVELRRYALHPGARETLIDLFDRELVETQEAVGMHVLGQFRDLDDPDRFVWLRGFADMRTRADGLERFYGGPVWRRHAAAANATMIDSDDVLLLRPARPGSGLVPSGERPAPGARVASRGIIVATVYSLRPAAADAFPEFFEHELEPLLRAGGAVVLASYRTEHAPNTFPALPIRDDAEVFVWFSRFDDEAAHARHLAQLEGSRPWRDGLSQALAERIDRPPSVLRLAPTARSLLRA